MTYLNIRAYMTLQFEWQNEKGNNCIMTATFMHPMDAWLSALSKCGWNQRCTLRTTDSKHYTISNWWDVSSKLPILCHPKNYASDYAFYKRKWT